MRTQARPRPRSSSPPSGTPRGRDDDRTPAATGDSRYPRESASARSISATHAVLPTARRQGRPTARRPGPPRVRCERPSPRWRRTAPCSPAELRARGRDLDAGIVDIGALIAADPALVGPVIDAVRGGADVIAAVRTAAEAQAALLAALPDPDLAQRAGDVRQVAAPLLGHLRGNSPPAPPEGKLHPGPPRGGPGRPDPAGGGRAGRRGVGSAAEPARTRRSSPAGSACPCWPGPTRQVLAAAAGQPRDPRRRPGAASLSSTLRNSTSPPPGRQVRAAARTRSAAPRRPGRSGTADGEQVTLLCNVASAAETRLGLSGGAAGVGLLRTEIAFIGASGWPRRRITWPS